MSQETYKYAASQLQTCIDDVIVFNDYMFDGLTNLYKHIKRLSKVALPSIQGDIKEFTSEVGKINVGNILYSCKSPNGIPFCFLLANVGFGQIELKIIVKKQNLLSLVRDLAKLIKANTKVYNIADFDYDKPILDPSFVADIEKYSINYLKILKQHSKLRLKGNRGLIFSGPPGNGKTMFCRALARQVELAGMRVVSFNGADINKAYSENNLDKLFKAGNLIFFDDIDVSYFSRKHNGQVSCSILSAMDGLYQSGGSIRVFTTNEHIEDMDPAFLRNGRIDKIYKFNPPTFLLRKRYIDTWFLEIENPGIDQELLAKTTEGFSFAQLSEVRNEILLRTVTNEPLDLEAVLKSFNVTVKKVGFK